ncbi:hypothetical protein F5Y14DRAFT_172207 [Nemania sp. NC0429]|nr:hypothetical protein F5Y14DRAFT_172207 [Nemania sp. NC0429]
MANERLQLTRRGFTPTVDDVINVRRILTNLGVNNHKIPMEIALMILSFASYHPYQSSIRESEALYRADTFWLPGPEASIAGLYLTLTTLSVPEDVARVKSITFQTRAADQGWATFGGEGTYENSHTWYEVSILRPRSEAPAAATLTDTDVEVFRDPGTARDYLRSRGWAMVENNGSVVWRVHNNVTACDRYNYYAVRWTAGIPTQVHDPRAAGDGEGFLELLRPGDVVALWARAEQQAWVNKICGATIEIDYTVL